MRARLMLALLAGAGCVGASATRPPTDATDESPVREDDGGSGVACGTQVCAAGERCIRYVGVAGPAVPLTTCGIACGPGPDHTCPEGLRCQRSADGPALCVPP